MSRMFHRVLAASAVGAAALAVPATALAADTGGGGGALPTRIAVHLPAQVRAGQPVTVSARITPQDGSGGEGTGTQPDGHRGKSHGTKGGGHRTGTGHGRGKGGKGTGRARHHALTGEVRFLLDGRAEPPVEVSHDQAAEKLRIPLGRHTLVAEYSGDADHLASRSAPVAFELAPGQTLDPGQDEGPGQGPDGFGPQEPGFPGQGVDQGDQGPDGQDQGDQDDQDGWQDGSGPDSGARAQGGAAQA